MNLNTACSFHSDVNVTAFPGVAACIVVILLTASAYACASDAAGATRFAVASEAMAGGVDASAAQAVPPPQTIFGETAEEREEQLSHPQTYAPQRLSVQAPQGDVPLGNPLVLPLSFAKGRLVDMYVKQFDKNGIIEQESNLPVKIVQDDGLKKNIEIVPAQLGTVTVEVGAIYLDNAWAIQTIHLNVVPSAKGLKKFSLQGPGALVMEDEEKDRQFWLHPVVSYEDVPNQIDLNESTQIKLSVEPDEGDPVIRVDNNGMVHALREETR